MTNHEGAGAESPRYDSFAIGLHWVSALLIVGMIVLGYTMVTVAPQTPLRGPLFNLHKSFGLVVFALTVIRIVWRATHRPPALPAVLPRWNRVVAQATHTGLVVVLLAHITAGYVMSEFGKYGIQFFGMPLPRWGRDVPAIREAALNLHHVMAVILVALLLLHIGGAVRHLFSGNGPLLKRMWWRD